MPEYQVVEDIHQWLDGSLPLVDLRSSNEFDDRHLSFVSSTTAAETSSASSSSNHEDASPIIIVNLPLSSLVNGKRACELPPRHLNFAILIPNQYAQPFLDKNDDCPIHDLFFASQSKSTLQSRIPWQVTQVLIDDEKLWKEASDMGLETTNPRRRDNNNEIDILSFSSFTKIPRLWKPDPLLVSDILPVLTNWMLDEDTSTVAAPHNSLYGLIWDLGCGAGRDVCYLAEEMKEIHSLLRHPAKQQQQEAQQIQLTRSIYIVGVDNHKGSEERTQLLWTNRNVHDITESITWDLNKLHLVRQLFMNPMRYLQKLHQKQPMKPDILCIYAIRYLNRKLFSYIANSHSGINLNDEGVSSKANTAAINNNYNNYTKSTKHHELPPPLVLPIGTIVAISHFCKPTDDASWRFDHPKESNVLERHELEQMFTIVASVNVVNDDDDDDDNSQARRWHILKNDIIMDGDHGRTLIQFVARKVA